MPVYRPQMASPSDSRISPGVFNGGLSSGLFSGLLSSSFDGDVMRYLGAQEDWQKALEHSIVVVTGGK
ncbi:hypothetical protein ACFX1X_044547 [Malus domestica]